MQWFYFLWRSTQKWDFWIMWQFYITNYVLRVFSPFLFLSFKTRVSALEQKIITNSTLLMLISVLEGIRTWLKGNKCSTLGYLNSLQLSVRTKSISKENMVTVLFVIHNPGLILIFLCSIHTLIQPLESFFSQRKKIRKRETLSKVVLKVGLTANQPNSLLVTLQDWALRNILWALNLYLSCSWNFDHQYIFLKKWWHSASFHCEFAYKLKQNTYTLK